MSAKKRAVVLINVGTPDAPDPASVRRYLREFLGDPRVLDMSALGRWLLLNLVILPFRPKKSAHAYQAIWTPQGSPLLLHSQAQREGLAARLPGVQVVLAMRYGRPSLAEAAQALAAFGPDEVVLAPLYPQYALATTLTSLEAAERTFGALPGAPPLRSVAPFYAHPEFIEAWAKLLEETLARAGGVQHVVFSYHGLPVHQVKATDATGAHCFSSEGCCDAVGEANVRCYRAQCFATSRALAQRLGLASHSTAFQSRLGRVPWIGPPSDQHVPELARKGMKRIAVACPSFVADCLETLEEVGLRLKESFLAAGGESFTLAPCLNAHPAWLDALAELCEGAFSHGEAARPRG